MELVAGTEANPVMVDTSVALPEAVLEEIKLGMTLSPRGLVCLG
jgi:hypothetical protein